MRNARLAASVCTVAVAIAFGAAQPAAGSTAPDVDSCGRWLDGAVQPLAVVRDARAGMVLTPQVSRIIDQRLAEAQDLVRAHPLDPPRAARAYAVSMLAARQAALELPPHMRDAAGVAIDHAFATAARGESIYAPQARDEVSVPGRARSLKEVVAAIVGIVSAQRVLGAAFDDGAAAATTARVSWDSDPARAARLGTWVPTSPGFLPPLQPGWGAVRGIGIDPIRIRPDIRPPAWTSERMHRERRAFLAVQDTVVPRDIDIAHRWNDGAGTPTPAGTWLSRANEEAHRLRLAPSARLELLAATAVALHDAFILTWERKYRHMTARPIQWMRAGPRKRWKPFIPTPPFPSWPSGHGLVSAAAAEVIARMLPAAADRQRAAAREAAESRVWAGIHWPVDSADALVLGRAVGDELARAGGACTS